MTRRAFDDRIVVSHPRLLRSLGNAINVRPYRDDRLARSPCRHPSGRDARKIPLDRKTVLFENVGQIPRRLELLEPKLSVAENLIDHLLREVARTIDVGGRLFLERV